MSKIKSFYRTYKMMRRWYPIKNSLWIAWEDTF